MSRKRFRVPVEEVEEARERQRKRVEEYWREENPELGIGQLRSGTKLQRHGGQIRSSRRKRRETQPELSQHEMEEIGAEIGYDFRIDVLTKDPEAIHQFHEVEVKELANPDTHIIYRGLADAVGALNAALSFDKNTAFREGGFIDGALDVFKNYMDVINWNMNQCLEPLNSKYGSTGRLHSLLKVSSKLIGTSLNRTQMRDYTYKDNSGEDYSIVALASKFEIISLHNSIFASLNFNVNSHSHDVTDRSIHFFMHAARYLLLTGALGGYSRNVILSRFSNFKINLLNSNGGREIGLSGGVRFSTTIIGPFKVQELLELNDIDFFGFIVEVNAVMENRMRTIFEVADRKHSEWDNTDITDFKYDDPAYEKGFERRFEVFQRRMEVVTFKFYPMVIEELNLVTAEPLKYQTKVLRKSVDINGNELVNIPELPLNGDIIVRPLDPDVYKVPVGPEDPPILAFTALSQKMLDRSKPMINEGDSGITNDFITDINNTARPHVDSVLGIPQEAIKATLENFIVIGRDDTLAEGNLYGLREDIPIRDLDRAIFRQLPEVGEGGEGWVAEEEEEEVEEMEEIEERESRELEEIESDIRAQLKSIDQSEVKKKVKQLSVNTTETVNSLYLRAMEEIRYQLIKPHNYDEQIEKFWRELKRALTHFFQLNSEEDLIVFNRIAPRPLSTWGEAIEEQARVLRREIPNNLYSDITVDIMEHYNNSSMLYTLSDSGEEIEIPRDPRWLELLPTYHLGRDHEKLLMEFRRFKKALILVINDSLLGCITKKEDKLEAALSRLSQIWCPPEAMDANCFFRCIVEALSLKDQVAHMPYLRKTIAGLEHDEHLDINQDIGKLVDHFNIDIYFWAINTVQYNVNEFSDQMMNISATKSKIGNEIKLIKILNPSSDEVIKEGKMRTRIDLLTHKHHCYLIKNIALLENKVKCSLCTQWINRKSFNQHAQTCHYCIQCRRSYSTKREPEHLCKGKSAYLKNKTINKQSPSSIPPTLILPVQQPTIKQHKTMTEVKQAKKMTPKDRIWLADLEAYPSLNDDSIFLPYAVGVVSLNEYELKEPRIFYGYSCMLEFFDFLEKVKGVLYYYNGSAFDNYLHIRAMVDAEHYIDSNGFIKHSNRIIGFKHHTSLKVRDLFLFIGTSLKKACKDWGVPQDMTKREFDHSKVFDWPSAMEHQEEATEYLKYDVISLACLTDKYIHTMFKCFSMDVTKCYTPSQFAVQCWSSMTKSKTNFRDILREGDAEPIQIACPITNEIFIPQQGKEEDDDRAAYYGGRVMCQRREYISQDYDDDPDKEWDYDEVTDYLIDADVNSLYPTAQIRFKYAFGPWEYAQIESEEQNHRACEELNLLVDEEAISRCMFKVNVHCPKDLITSFLVERDPITKAINHTLLDKEKQWYWGSELIEAIILGYRVTRVHEIKEFKKWDDIFSEYVMKCWNGRKANPKPSVVNLAYKAALNCLTGKFGQRSHPTSCVIYNTNYKPSKRTEKDLEILINKIVDFEPIFDDYGANSAIMLELENDNKDPSYPIYLSGQILANSRVYMSRIMRGCNAYLDPRFSFYYTDTDSLVLPARSIPILESGNLIGSALGQLSCDLHEPNQRGFAKILRGVWAAKKGPYSLVYLGRDERKLKERVRVKGIPHTNEPFDHHEEIEIVYDKDNEEDLQRVFHLVSWVENPYQHNRPMDIVSERLYLYKSNDKEIIYFTKHINLRMIKMMMQKEGEVYCVYGGMKRNIIDRSGNILTIKPSLVKRTLCKTDWWLSGERFFFEDEQAEGDLSYPTEYEVGREEINYEVEHLTRLAQLF
jgi:hypothetical protein